MPLFALICTDKADRLDLRMATRAAHLAYVQDTGVVQQAGALLDHEGKMSGSLVILDVPDRAAAEAWAAADPYARAGLFAKVRIEHWNRVIG